MARARNLLLIGALLFCAPARAQDVATAAAAFDKALEEMNAENWAVACPLFAESHRLDPRPAVLFTQAECEARWGKLATALAHYDDFLAILARLPADQRRRHRDREAIAVAQKRELARRVPRITLILPSSAPSGTRVDRNGIELGAPLLGVELPVDPGKHVITTRTPDGAARRHVIDAAPGSRQRVVLGVAGAHRRAAVARAPDPEPVQASPSSTQRDIGYVSLGVGIAGVIVGAVAGALAIERKSVVDEHCDGPACDQEGKDAADVGKTYALVSTIATAVGLGGAALGVTLLATEPDRERGDAGGVRLGVSGRF